jgi:hypothetical protein
MIRKVSSFVHSVVKNLIYKGFMEMKLKTKCTHKLLLLSFTI